jgi:hypothetical protein
MPEIWVTVAEFANFLGRDARATAEAVAGMGLAHRVCDDGATRVRLPADRVAAYLAAVPAVRAAVLGGRRDLVPPLRDIDELALVAAASAGGPDYVAGEFTDLMVSRLRAVQTIAASAERAASVAS